jgi:predicted flavoprotein YhiN
VRWFLQRLILWRKIRNCDLERGAEVLKVRISGGGRCNVTHACFEPNELVKFYPVVKRTHDFHQFCSGDHRMVWKTRCGAEDDGRLFQIHLKLSSIVFTSYDQIRIKVLTGQSVQSIFKRKCLETQNENYITEKLILATGSNPKIWEMLQSYGHAIVNPVPLYLRSKMLELKNCQASQP